MIFSLDLDHLLMKDSHYITKYKVMLATVTGYGERAPYTIYYHGLASRIKGALATSGKPTPLEELRTKARALDLRFWE